MRKLFLLAALAASPAMASITDSIQASQPRAWCGEYVTFTTTHVSTAGVADIGSVYFHVGAKGANFHAYWKSAANKLYLQNEAGTSWGTGVTPSPTAAPLSNAHGTLDVTAFTVTATDSNTLVLTWRVTVTEAIADEIRYSQVAGVMSRTAANAGQPWKEMWAHFLVERPDEIGGILFAGDSIMARWDTLQSDFPGYTVGNRGNGGIRADELMSEVEWSVTPYQPSAVVLLVGINDLRRRPDAVACAAAIVATVAKLRETNPTLPVVVCSIMPHGYESKQVSPALIVEANTRVKCALEGVPGITFCDTFKAFALVPSLQPDPVEFPDLLHPAPAAYAKWKDALTPILAGL
jgi:lysophospholipase L1-like esterase